MKVYVNSHDNNSARKQRYDVVIAKGAENMLWTNLTRADLNQLSLTLDSKINIVFAAENKKWFGKKDIPI